MSNNVQSSNFDNADMKNELDQASTYIRRFPPEFQVVYFRGLVHRHPELKRQSEFKRNMLHLTKIINDDDPVLTGVAHAA